MTKPLRVLYVALVELDVPGGPAVHVANLMRGFHDIGVPTTLLAPRPRGPLAVEVAPTVRTVPFFGFGPLRLWIYDLLQAVGMILSIARSRPDLICLRDRGQGNRVALLLARSFGIPYILELNGRDPIDDDRTERGAIRGSIERWRRRARRRELADADAVVVNSEPLAAHIQTRYQLSVEKVRCVTMRVDGDRFRPLSKTECRTELGISQSALILGYLGSFQPTHDLESVLQALRHLLDRNIEARLRLIGSGNDLELFQNRVKELSLEDAVDLLGWVPHEQIPVELNAIDVALSLLTEERRASAESLCKVKEFLACGVPTIINREGVPGFREYPPGSVTPVALDDPTTAGADLADVIMQLDRSRRLETSRYVAREYSLASAARETIESISEEISLST